MKTLGKIIYGLFVTALVGVAALLLVSLMPITGNLELKIVKSGSMEPSIPTGSIVVVMPRASYQVGDVVTFGKDTPREIPTTHRVIAKRVENGQTVFTTKGDANEEQDPRDIALREVIGGVLFHVPYLGYVLDFARQPLGFALLIGLPATMIVVDEALNIAREVAALRRRRHQGSTLMNMPVPQKPRVFSERTRIPTL
ncbi:signal peptidase I [Candidatus Adlerbacteria bacterium RIFCSPHIGHO2_12_FULL_53_18]|uniref:Signal peptidase I n=2 Tax=Parcubacteria group TaxID=1794811 RepID=A0A1F4XRI5_9BACT|nr:MAG: signal peptidase I [Candidatus Adlerbacteria bacterium RIFCSPHIGHO2_12_FULL_53_18]OGG51478.1 MAG: signal peptidase I [Candidatus Kaiserbacteria bacterium RIFCSPHIGHO2_01_FULL_54_36b]